LEAAWHALADPDAARAYAGLPRLLATPEQTTAWLQARLRPTAPLQAGRVAGWLAALDDPRFATREQAARQIVKQPLMLPILRQQLRQPQSLELRRRVELLIDAMDEPAVNDVQELRALRCVLVLERVNTPAARQLLQALAGGAPQARLTLEAQAALKRVATP
jgi:hypothetical protein